MTGKTPAELLFGRKLRVKIPATRDIPEDSEVRDRDSEYKQKMVESRNSKLTAREIKVGELVLLKRDNCNKTDTVFHKDPFTVKEVKGNMVVVESGDGRYVRRNISFVKPYLLPDACIAGSERSRAMGPSDRHTAGLSEREHTEAESITSPASEAMEDEDNRSNVPQSNAEQAETLSNSETVTDETAN